MRPIIILAEAFGRLKGSKAKGWIVTLRQTLPTFSLRLALNSSAKIGAKRSSQFRTVSWMSVLSSDNFDSSNAYNVLKNFAN